MICTLPSRDKCTYTPYYCEENIYCLCKTILELDKSPNKCYCVFISNYMQAIHLWKQQKGSGEDKFVIWDYHVIALYGDRNDGYFVFDLDTVLSFPVSFKEYVKESIRAEDNFPNFYRRYFRVVPAAEYITNFSSDRRHMKISGTWRKPPPCYPPIINNLSHPYNLNEFINMNKGEGYGEVLNQEEFIKKFGI